MRKTLLLCVLIAFVSSLTFAKQAYVDINQMRLFVDDSTMIFTGPQYPQKAGGNLNTVWPDPGGRTYTHGPTFVWGNSFEVPAQVTASNVESSGDYAWDAVNGYTSGAVVTGSYNNSEIAATYPITVLGLDTYTAGGLLLSTEKTGANYNWYQPNTSEGSPTKKWPYNDKRFAYSPASLEIYESASDAYLGAIAPDVYDLYVEDPDAITSLSDYMMIYNGTQYQLFPITSYTDDDGMKPVWSSTPVASFNPDTATSIPALGIHITMTSGSETPIANGDKYIIRARGTVSDQDLILPIVDSKLVFDPGSLNSTWPMYGKMGVTVLIRVYAWQASYLDTMALYDITYVNTSTRDYDNFFAGAFHNIMIAHNFDDVVRYFSDENLFLVYDFDGMRDSYGTSGTGSVFSEFGATDDEVTWHQGDFGTSPYAMLGFKITEELANVDGTPADRFTFITGYPAHYFAYQNGSADPLDSTGQYKFTPIVKLMPLTGQDFNNMFTDAGVNHYGLNDEVAGNEPPHLTNTDTHAFNGWLWGEDLVDAFASGQKFYAWHPDTIMHIQKNWYQRNGLSGSNNPRNRRTVGSLAFGWYLGSLEAGEMARFQYAMFAVPQNVWGWTAGTANNGIKYPGVGDAAYDRAMEYNDDIDLLVANKLAPKLTPIRPLTTSRAYSRYVANVSNHAVEIEWEANSETSFVTKIKAEFAIDHYMLQKFDGQAYQNILKLPPAYTDYWNATPFWGSGTLFDLESLWDFVFEMYLYTSYGSGNTNYFAQLFTVDANVPGLIWFTPAGLDGVMPGWHQGSPEKDNLRVGFIIEGWEDLIFTEIAAGNPWGFPSAYYGGYIIENPEVAQFKNYVVVNTSLIFGYDYKYRLAAYDTTGMGSPISGYTNMTLRPGAVAEPTATALKNIKVVPNPLILGTRWDKYADVTQVKFNHMPESNATIKIYNISGDLLRVIEHTDGTTTATWDLLTKHNQEVAPGLYIYVVIGENGEKTKGTFSIIR